MNTYCYTLNSNCLVHYGIRGQRWGERKYQYNDGSLTAAGRLRYGIGIGKRSLSSLSKMSVKSLNNRWVDTLDKYNQKGYLDWLDKKADAPFKNVKRTTGYISSANRDPFKAIENMSRYLDMDAYSKTSSPETRAGEYKQREQQIYSNLMNDYNARYSNKYSNIGRKWSDAIRKRTGQSTIDKQLGMISKSARDRLRAQAGLDFMTSMRKSGWNVEDITSRWHNTDDQGRKRSFTGHQWEYTMGTTKVPDYKEVVTPEHVRTRTFRQFKMLGSPEEGLMGRKSIDSKTDDTLYRWKKKYDPDYGREVEYVDLPSFYRVPEERKVVRSGWKDVPVINYDTSKPTREYLDYLAREKMPSDYSNITNRYTDRFAKRAQRGIDYIYGR